MIGEEDVFNSVTVAKPETLIIRYSEQSKRRFNESNKVNGLEKIIGVLSVGSWDCYFTKRTDSEFQISIPIQGLEGQVNLVVEYDQIKYTYLLKVQYNQKSRFKPSISIPSPEYCFCVKAKLVFLDEHVPWANMADLVKLQELKNRAMALDVAPGMTTELQEDIWHEYIEAQSQIIDDLMRPYECIGDVNVIPEESNVREGEIYRYKLEFQLPHDGINEYKALADKLREDLNIDTYFDSEGVAYLTADDIFRGLKPVIEKNFSDRYELDGDISCIISVSPRTAADSISQELPNTATYLQAGVYVLAKDVKIPIPDLISRMSVLGYIPASTSVDYRIKGVINLFQSEHVDKYSLSFSSNGTFQKPNHEKEILLPEPIGEGSMFRVEHRWKEDYMYDYTFFTKTLGYIYGSENVEQTLAIKFKPVEWVEHTKGFSDELWNDIYKDIYALPWSFTIGDAEDGKTIYFEFKTQEQLEEIYSGLVAIDRFNVKKSPLDHDFAFKVRTHLISKKSLQETFREKLSKLNGAEFVHRYAVEDEDTGRLESYLIPMGKLNSFESSMDKLVTYLPNIAEEDKENIRTFLKFIHRHPQVDSIYANLVGDRAKIGWLKEAMSKLRTSGTWEPNTQAINPNIKEFIFDSSKAEPVFKYETIDIRDTYEFEKFDETSILKLNESQKEAVLKATAARDLCMLQGPPGPGKTTVIAELIWQFIRENQNSKLLLTSETNLAVDNALEKLMNGKAANPEMVRFLTLIKPLRFGSASKFEEEGKRYSLDRIEKWIDGAAKVEEEFENEILSEGDGLENEEAEDVNVNDNVVQNWMRAIADRSSTDPRYRDVLKDWNVGLALPDVLTKEYFRDLYLRHVNVVGSTCSSTGSPAFFVEYLKTFGALSRVEAKDVSRKLHRLKSYQNKEPALRQLADVLGIAESSIDEIKCSIGNICNIAFDTVIMDEASKATPPELLMPLCFGHKSVIIGDHRQLPPMLNEKSFREALLELGTHRSAELADEIDRAFVDTSQFKRMILHPTVSPTIKATFNTQYRMHPYINDVIKQFYKNDECGGLICGLDPERVNLKDLSIPESRYHGFYKEGFITPDIHTIWVHVDAPESDAGTSKVNETEVEAINKIINLLSTSRGFQEYMSHWDTLTSDAKRTEEKEIGVISFYGRQVRKIRETVRPFAKKLGIRIKMNTVDKFQGMERNIVIVSTVRSDKQFKNNRVSRNFDAGFAKSPERLNVALSRARRLLIVVGNKDFFSNIKDREGNFLYRNAINEIERSGRVINYSDLK